MTLRWGSVLLALPLIAGLLSAPDANASGQQLLADAQRATAVTEGRGPHAIYIFFDPNCAYCHLLYETLQPLIPRDQLTIHWIPVGIVNATSPGKAAAILEARSPAGVLAYNEAHYHTQGEEGGIAETLASRRTAALVRRNDRFLAEAAPVDAVPTMVLRQANGEALVIQGALSPLALQKVLNKLPR